MKKTTSAALIPISICILCSGCGLLKKIIPPTPVSKHVERYEPRFCVFNRVRVPAVHGSANVDAKENTVTWTLKPTGCLKLNFPSTKTIETIKFSDGTVKREQTETTIFFNEEGQPLLESLAIDGATYQKVKATDDGNRVTLSFFK